MMDQREAHARLDRTHFVSQSKSMKPHFEPRLAARKPAFVLALIVFLAGNFALTQAAEFKRGSYLATRPNGDAIVLKFEDGGKFSLADKDGKVLVAGAYKATKREIEFTDEKGPMASTDAKPDKYEMEIGIR